jgi:hypothetical protein
MFNGSKSHRLWYAAVGREAKKEIVAKMEIPVEMEGS